MTLLANGADARAPTPTATRRCTTPRAAPIRPSRRCCSTPGASLDALNAEGHSPLGIACAAGNWRLARFLIEHGAKPEPRAASRRCWPRSSRRRRSGRRAAAAAAQGARGRARRRQRTALMQACAAGNVDIVGVLLDAGADRNAHDADG